MLYEEKHPVGAVICALFILIFYVQLLSDVITKAISLASFFGLSLMFGLIGYILVMNIYHAKKGERYTTVELSRNHLIGLFVFSAVFAMSGLICMMLEI